MYKHEIKHVSIKVQIHCINIIYIKPHMFTITESILEYSISL